MLDTLAESSLEATIELKVADTTNFVVRNLTIQIQ